MSILPLVEYPNPLLHEKSKPVTCIDDDLRKTLDDMLETMYADKGVGLAAPQVGLLKRMIVIDAEQQEDETGKHVKGKPMFIINPEIITASEETIIFCEGCLSVPGQKADVVRHQKITVRYQDKEGKQKTIEAEDYLAVILQHEIDHLDGILYIDHLSRLKRNMLLKKLQKSREKEA